MKLKIFILIYLIAPFLFAAKPKFSDNQIIAMTPHYFERNHTSPELLGVNIYKSRQGRVYQIDIQVDRNRVNDDLSFAYSVAEGLKVPRLLEASPDFPVVFPVGFSCCFFLLFLLVFIKKS